MENMGRKSAKSVCNLITVTVVVYNFEISPPFMQIQMYFSNFRKVSEQTNTIAELSNVCWYSTNWRGGRVLCVM